MRLEWPATVRRLLANARARARTNKRRIALGGGGVVLAPLVFMAVLTWLTPLPPELREPAAPSLRVLARDGELLREVRTNDGSRSRPLPLSAFPAPVRNAVLAAEDRHFYAHFGVDFGAVARALVDDLLARRIVSGASTITMQLARTLRPPHARRSLWGKVRETALALRIEASLSKDAILEEYLNRVVYGPNVRGYAAASSAYFGTPPESLSLAQAALIAGLPRGPSLYDVNKRPALAKRRRDRILERMAAAELIDEGARDRAIAEPLVTSHERPSFGAPHFVRGLVGGGPIAQRQPGLAERLSRQRPSGPIAEIRTTLDPRVQRAAEGAVTAALASTNVAGKHVTAAAVVVIENATGDVLAWVGSPDFYGAAILGQNDGVLALRQPGSSLKPFVYAEAMTSLGYTGATVLPDIELHIPLPGGGDYVPHDYDGKLKGAVRLREALGNSLNVPAVDTIHRLGTARVLDRLHALGFASLTEDAEHYGPALALGDGEVTLLELANAYAALANGGLLRPVRVVSGIRTALASPEHEVDAPPKAGGAPLRGIADVEELERAPAARVLDERVTAILTDILADKTARMSAFGDQNVLELDFDVAAKTGTSKGYRDNVTVGYTREVTVGVWVGNFDGSPMVEVSGITGAGPIFHDVMVAAAEARPPRAPLVLAHDAERASRVGLERAAVCALSGEIATSVCPHRIHEWLPAGDADHAPPCSVHERVRVDLQNGLRAGPACDRERTAVRVFERWRAPFDTWAAAAGRAVVPIGSSPACPVDEPVAKTGDGDSNGDRDGDRDASTAAVADSRAPRITYPFEGARFVIDPERPSALQLLDVGVEPSGREIRVTIDGAALAADRRWPLASGEHLIKAEYAGRAAAPVRFSVR